MVTQMHGPVVAELTGEELTVECRTCRTLVRYVRQGDYDDLSVAVHALMAALEDEPCRTPQG